MPYSKRIAYETRVQALDDIPGFEDIARDVYASCKALGVKPEKFVHAHITLANHLIAKTDMPPVITYVIDPVGTNRHKFFEQEGVLLRQAAFHVSRDGLLVQRDDVAHVLSANIGLDYQDFNANPHYRQHFTTLMRAAVIALMNEAAVHEYPIMLSWGAQSEVVDNGVRRLQENDYKVDVILHASVADLNDTQVKSLANRRYFEFRDAAHAREKIDAQVSNMHHVIAYHMQHADTVRLVHADDSVDNYRGDVARRGKDGSWDILDHTAFQDFKARYQLFDGDGSMDPNTDVAFPLLDR